MTGAERLGRNLSEAMARRGMTQAELARSIYASEAAVSRYVHGRQAMGSVTLALACRAIPCDPAELLRGVADADSPDAPRGSELRRRVIGLRRSGVGSPEVARRLGVDRRTVSAIMRAYMRGVGE